MDQGTYPSVSVHHTDSVISKAGFYKLSFTSRVSKMLALGFIVALGLMISSLSDTTYHEIVASEMTPVYFSARWPVAEGEVLAVVTSQYYSNSADGRVAHFSNGCDQTVWTTAHSQSSAGASTSSTTRSNIAGTSCSEVGQLIISRGFLAFDTSAIPDDATINSAVLKVYATNKRNSINDTNDYLAIVAGQQASGTNLVDDDFDQAGNTVVNPIEGSNRLDISSITTSAYAQWSLNSTGLGWLSKTGTTKLALREGHDIQNLWVNYASGQGNFIDAAMSETTGTAQDPVLEITYTTSGSPTPTPTPTAGPTPTPTATPTAGPTPTPTPTAVPTPTPTPPASNVPPTGFFDGIQADGTMYGWAHDTNDLNAPVQIHIYFDGPTTGTPLVATANVYRSDIGTHAFNVAVPSQYRNGVQHSAYIYAIDLTDTSGASNRLLSGSPRYFTLGTGSPTPTPTPAPTPTPTGGASACTGSNCINLNSSTTYQTMDGWEVHPQSGQSDAPAFNSFKDALFDSAVNDLGINRVRIEFRSGAENPIDAWTRYLGCKNDPNSTVAAACYQTWRNSRYDIVNDNTNPNSINPSGFYWSETDSFIDTVVIPLRQKLQARGEQLYINVNYVDFGGSTFEHKSNPAEYAEFVLAAYQHLATKGITPDSWEIILEPDTGSANWTFTQVGQAIKAAGDRLVAAGYTPRFIAPSPTNGLELVPTNQGGNNRMSEIAAVPGAMQYIHTISYHRYGSPSLSQTQSIAAIAAGYGKKTAMLEFIGADYNLLHRDLKYGNNSAWQQFALAFPGTIDDGGAHYLINNNNGTFGMASRSKLLRQYFRHIRIGAVRYEASNTGNPFIDPVAFRNTDGKHVVVTPVSGTTSFGINGLPAGTYGIFYTTNGGSTTNLTSQTITSGQAVNLSNIPAGVVTVYATTGGGPAPTPTPTPAPTPTPGPTPTPIGNVPPTGNFDGIHADGTMFGWAHDTNDLNQPVQIHIYYDGPTTGTPQVAAASDTRSDVGNHAFNVAIPSQYRNGVQHSAYIYAIDLNDTSGASNRLLSGSPKTFTLSVPDNQNPAVNITAPANGATLSGTSVLTVNATDNIGVAGVQWKVDGVNIGSEVTSSPFSANWVTGSVTDGLHTLTAVARDAAGNTATSSGVGVTVNNAPAANPVFSPNGGTVTTSQSISITSATNGAAIRFTDDGSTPTSTHGVVYAGPFTLSSNRTIKAIAYGQGMISSGVVTAVFTVAVPTPTPTPVPTVTPTPTPTAVPTATPSPTPTTSPTPTPTPPSGNALYAAPNGSPTGNGSINAPWDLQTALSQSSSVTNGKTIYMRGGTYNGKYISYLSNTTLRSYPGEWAKIDGYYTATLASSISAGTGYTSYSPVRFNGSFTFTPSQEVWIDNELVQINVVNGDGSYAIIRGWGGTPPVAHSIGAPALLGGTIFNVQGSNTTFRDFEVMSSNPFRSFSGPGAGADSRREGTGVAVGGDDIKTVNLVIHDTVVGLGVSESADDFEAYGLIVYNNGHVAPDRPHGHGLYVQNDTGGIDYYKEILSFNNFALGMKAYGANQGHSNNVYVTGFLGFNNGTPGYYPGNPTQFQTYNRGYSNLEIGSDVHPSNNISVLNSMLYHKPATTVEIPGLWLGRAPTGGNIDAVIKDNFIAEPHDEITFNQWSNVTGSGNTLVMNNGADPMFVMNGGNRSTFNWDNNTYYGVGRTLNCIGGNKPAPFIGFGLTGICGIFMDWNEWKSTTGLDANSTYIPSRPTGKNIFVRPNAYEPGRANIAVYNWDLSSTVNVNLSGAGLTPGQRFEIRSAENYMGGAVLSNQTYTSGMTVNLPAGSRTVVTPIGHSYTPASTCPEFCAYVVVPITSGSQQPIPTPTPQPTPTPVPTPTPPPANVPPTGSFDGIHADGTMFGWAHDTNNLNVPVQIHIYYDGTGTPQVATASDFRSDVGSHAFNVSIPSQYRNGVQHSASIYAIDLTDTSGNSNRLLGGSPRTFTLGSSAPTPTPNPGDTTPPVISNINAAISAGDIKRTVIAWTTNEPSNSQVEFGLTTSYGINTPILPEMVVNHRVVLPLTNLSVNTTYHYRVKSRDASNNLAISSDRTFTTKPRPSKPPKPSGLIFSQGSIVLSWPSLDYDLCTAIEVHRSGTASPQTATTTTLLSSLACDATSYHDEAVTPGNTYYYSLFVKDDVGAYSDPLSGSFTAPQPSTTPTPTPDSGGGGGGGGGGGSKPKPTPTPTPVPGSSNVILPANVIAGQVIKFGSNNTLYLVQSTGLHPFDTYQSFLDYANKTGAKVIVKSGQSTTYTVSPVLAKDKIGQTNPAPQPTPEPTEELYEGANFICAGSGTVYYLANNNEKQAYPDASVYEAWNGNNWGLVVQVSSQLCSKISGNSFVRLPERTLVRVPNGSEIYRVEGGTARPFTSFESLKRDHGANASIRVIPLNYLHTYPRGENIL